MADNLETQIAALYQKHGHALFHACLAALSRRGEALSLVEQTFRTLFERRVRGASLNNLLSISSELSHKQISGDSNDVQFARYLSEDMPPSQRADLESEVAADSAFKVRLAVLRSDRAAFYAADPATQFAQRIAAAIPHDASPPRGKVPLAVAGIVTLLAAAFVMTREGTRIPPADEAPPTTSQAPTSQPVALPSPPQATSLPASAPTVADADTKTADTKTADTKSADTKSADTKSADTKSADTKSADTKTADAQTAIAPTAASGEERLMATFDFGETLGRVSFFEGRAKQKAVPAGTVVQVRAKIPGDGYVVLMVQAPGEQLRALTAVLKVTPRWQPLSRVTVDAAQSLIVVFDTQPFSVPKVINDDARQARIDLTLEAP